MAVHWYAWLEVLGGGVSRGRHHLRRTILERLLTETLCDEVREVVVGRVIGDLEGCVVQRTLLSRSSTQRRNLRQMLLKGMLGPRARMLTVLKSPNWRRKEQCELVRMSRAVLEEPDAGRRNGKDRGSCRGQQPRVPK